MVGLHRFARWIRICRQAMACRTGPDLAAWCASRALRAINAMIPFAAAALGMARGMRDALRPWPYFAGFALGNYIGLWRGPYRSQVPAQGRGRKLLVAAAGGTVRPSGSRGGRNGCTSLFVISLAHPAYDGRLLLVTLAILVIAVPFEVGRGAGRAVSVIARYVAPFTAWAVLLGLVLSGLRLARVIGLCAGRWSSGRSDTRQSFVGLSEKLDPVSQPPLGGTFHGASICKRGRFATARPRLACLPSSGCRRSWRCWQPSFPGVAGAAPVAAAAPPPVNTPPPAIVTSAAAPQNEISNPSVGRYLRPNRRYLDGSVLPQAAVGGL